MEVINVRHHSKWKGDKKRGNSPSNNRVASLNEGTIVTGVVSLAEEIMETMEVEAGQDSN